MILADYSIAPNETGALADSPGWVPMRLFGSGAPSLEVDIGRPSCVTVVSETVSSGFSSDTAGGASIDVAGGAAASSFSSRANPSSRSASTEVSVRSPLTCPTDAGEGAPDRRPLYGDFATSDVSVTDKDVGGLSVAKTSSDSSRSTSDVVCREPPASCSEAPVGVAEDHVSAFAEPEASTPIGTLASESDNPCKSVSSRACTGFRLTLEDERECVDAGFEAAMGDSFDGCGASIMVGVFGRSYSCAICTVGIGSRFSMTAGNGDSSGDEMEGDDTLRFLLELPEKLRKKLRRLFRFSESGTADT